MAKLVCYLFVITLLINVILIVGTEAQNSNVVCGARENYVVCPKTCTEFCIYGEDYGTGYQQQCRELPGVCGEEKCACAWGYIRDPVSDECWKRSYCYWQVAKTKIDRLFGWNMKKP